MTHSPALDRRTLLAGLGGLAAGAASGCNATATATAPARRATPAPRPAMVGSDNALPGMQAAFARLAEGGDPLELVLEVVARVEADPEDSSVGLGGLPNAEGVVQLDAAVMHGPTHSAGAVASLENILHPCLVARKVMETTPHVLLVGRGAYEFARKHGHPHTELLTEKAREAWERWRQRGARTAGLEPMDVKRWGTVHCSALSVRGEVACTTTTSGLAFKLPGRVGDSPIVGAGLWCDQEGGSAGSTGRGESAILAHGSAAIVDLLAAGWSPKDAGMEILRRIDRQMRLQAQRLPSLLDAAGLPTFGLSFYVLGLDGTTAGVNLRGGGRYAVADESGGPRHEPMESLHA